jgi:hypothetical protein
MAGLGAQRGQLAGGGVVGRLPDRLDGLGGERPAGPDAR